MKLLSEVLKLCGSLFDCNAKVVRKYQSLVIQTPEILTIIPDCETKAGCSERFDQAIPCALEHRVVLVIREIAFNSRYLI